MLAGAALPMLAYGTLDIAAILQAARAAEGGLPAQIAARFLTLAAIIISAQFPLHGRLSEVMEAPTPVSAQLHVGVINADGLLLIRFADVMLLLPAMSAGLVMVGGFTALFVGLVMLTQPAVKTSLALPTAAQMGFMIMQCGFALFPFALLLILAHSLYKAHSFLASGGAIEQIAAFKRPGRLAVPDAKAVALAFVAALGIYAVMSLGLDFGGNSPQAGALGAILIFGVLIAGAVLAPRLASVAALRCLMRGSISIRAMQEARRASDRNTPLINTCSVPNCDWQAILSMGRHGCLKSPLAPSINAAMMARCCPY